MKNKILKSIGVILSMCIVVTISVFLNEIFGNPISKILAERAVVEYLDENYSDSGFIIEKVG